MGTWVVLTIQFEGVQDVLIFFDLACRGRLQNGEIKLTGLELFSVVRSRTVGDCVKK